MIITGFGDAKRACSNDSDSSESSDLSDLSKIESRYSDESGNYEKLERKRDTMIKYTGKYFNDC